MIRLWKRTLTPLSLALLLMALSGVLLCQAGSRVDVYILAGQSNAEGHNSADTYTPAPFPAALRHQTNVLFWPGSNAKPELRNTWTTLQIGASGINPSAFGPEIGFGHAMAADRSAAPIGLIKFAVGGTGIARSQDYHDYISHPQLVGFNDHGNHWHWPDPGKPAGNLYTNLLANIENALKGLKDQGTPYRLAGFLWMQGEHEAGISPSMARDYEGLLEGLIRHLRADLHEPELPFVIGEISDRWIFGPVVQAAQSNVCHKVSHTALVETRDLPRPPADSSHYTANGVLTLGSRFAVAMKRLQITTSRERRAVAPGIRPGTAGESSSARADSAASKTNHWAYQPIQRLIPPAVKAQAWPRSDIDRFILARIEDKGMSPTLDADATVLCRRLYFGLTGLPPTPEELEDFIRSAATQRDAATVSLVDRLLASPRFGEHWGRHWLDVVRYGESVTLRGFIFKEAWRYRDYVIEMFNHDRPFDQFIQEQIAGDLLPYRTVEEHQRQVIATTFLALGNWNLEEQDKRQLDMDVVDEQLDTIGKAFLGQTLGCARCHDHKFDPIPTRDYYAMAGILKNSQTLKHANVSEWIEVALPMEAEQEERLAKHEKELAGLRQEIDALKAAVKAKAGATGKESTQGPAVIEVSSLPGVVVDSAQARLVGQWKHSRYSQRYIGEGYWHDDNSGKGDKTLSFTPRLDKAGQYEVRLAYIHAENRATNIGVTVFHADGEAIVRINQQEAPAIDGRFVSLGQFRFETNGFGYVLISNDGTQGHVTADAVQFLPVEELAAAGRKASGSGAAEATSSKTGQGLPSSTRGNAQERIKSLEAQLKKRLESGPKRPMSMGVKEADKPGNIPIHLRGSVHTLGPVVPRGFLSVVRLGTEPAIPEHQSGRRELASWIASSDNPLTARVMANRVWLWLMGEGLVRTPDNFGTTGDLPSHPDLLDHLATRFVEGSWSLKTLVREVVLSRTYQLSSIGSETAAVRDPENHLFSHAHRRRLTAEQIRDALLTIGGRLKLGSSGPTYPPARTADFGFVFDEPLRSVYAPVFRNALPEIFDVFDFAPSSMVTGRRTISTVPTQALVLLNHPFVRQQAEAAAGRLIALPAKDAHERIDHAYLQSLGRSPTRSESALALRHLSGVEAANVEDAWTELYHALFASADFRSLD